MNVCPKAWRGGRVDFLPLQEAIDAGSRRHATAYVWRGWRGSCYGTERRHACAT